ncbi:metal ABC transporter permease [Rhodomicrobium udaipurense JA643]|uniref:ABC transporter ATP-binding protein/permease n=1 Tax=Rhodomicrobium udaipurense TaxID=1202716 RepID=A0A8I1GDL4_9HYPH|nr:ABC transporter ATP-binding protein/permease [Rhodomicrobium udaipurense]KAI94919.1 metal ABC transporter permease [Rhodomicrobium udaipurense JA643]MBJ7543960.1 ABC transporter ATP-binding protein/permease [Rhodomicrobium udaipurense]
MHHHASRSVPPEKHGKTDHKAIFRYLLPFAWPKGRADLKARLVLAAVVLVAAKVVTVFMPVTYKYAIDALTAMPKTDGAQAAWTLAAVPLFMTLAYAGARIAMTGFQQLRDVLFAPIEQNATRMLTTSAFRHVHDLSLRFHLDRKTGGLTRVFDRGKIAVDLIIRMGVLNLVPTILEVLFVCLLFGFYFGWTFVAIVLGMIVIYTWYSIAVSEKRIAIRREYIEADTDATTKAVDSLLNYETVKYFGNERWEADRFDRSMQRYERASIKTATSLAALNFGQTVIFTVGMVTAMALSAHGVATGAMTVGDFVLINAVFIQLYQPLNLMGVIYREIKQAFVDIEALFELIGQKPEVKDKPGAKPLIVGAGAIRFDNVTFSYDGVRPILRGVDFEVPPGHMVALVGPSGAGKSTISRLLYRFYDVKTGRITIDGQDVRDVTQESLRAAIGIVPQDTVLFNDTIEYNIRYGRVDATDAEMREAARMAQIDGFIKQLPLGYKSMVGERGLKLSGGEKQRVAIARTILKGPPILILDEATSALDSFTEKEIQAALDSVAKGRTTLVIAHRLSTVIGADTILVLDKGRIVERGTHASLLEARGLYAALWTRQQEAEEARRKLAEMVEEGALPTVEPNASGAAVPAHMREVQSRRSCDLEETGDDKAVASRT